MFIRVTNEKYLRFNKIIGVFDLDSSTIEKTTRDFLSHAESDGILVPSLSLPKTFVLTNSHVILSQKSKPSFPLSPKKL